MLSFVFAQNSRSVVWHQVRILIDGQKKEYHAYPRDDHAEKGQDPIGQIFFGRPMDMTSRIRTAPPPRYFVIVHQAVRVRRICYEGQSAHREPREDEAVAELCLGVDSTSAPDNSVVPSFFAHP